MYAASARFLHREFTHSKFLDTEIDFTTYMRQIDVYKTGELDYSLLKGPSGPLVYVFVFMFPMPLHNNRRNITKISYPAGHVFIHRFLHAVTSGGANMKLAQQIYGVLYIISQIMTIALYSTAGDIPNWALVILPLSKRLHSIYVLRMFNDCWAMPILLSSILMYTRRQHTAGSVLFRLVTLFVL